MHSDETPLFTRGTGMTTACEWCGEPIPTTAGTGRLPRFCKTSHRQRAYEKRKADAALAEARKQGYRDAYVDRGVPFIPIQTNGTVQPAGWSITKVTG